MADEADSKSVVGNHVRVQVPLPAVVGNSCKLKGSLIEPMVYGYFFAYPITLCYAALGAIIRIFVRGSHGDGNLPCAGCGLGCYNGPFPFVPP